MDDKRKPKNKYGNWLRNFGRSTAFSSIEILKETAPFIGNTISNLHEDISEIKSDLQNLRSNKKQIINYLTDDEEFSNNVSTGVDSIKKAFKTGEFSKSDEDSMDPDAIGDEFNFDETGDFDFDDSDDDSDSLTTAKNGKFSSVPMGPTKIVNVNGPSNGAINQLNKNMVNVGDNIARGFAASNRLSTEELSISLALNKKYFSETGEKITKINDSLNSIISFNNEAVSPFLQGSLKYYDDSLKILQEINESAKSINQRYSKPEDDYSSNPNSVFSNIFQSDGSVSFGSLFKNVAANAKTSFSSSALGSGLGALGMIMGMGQMMNPASVLLELGLSSLMPDNLKRTLSRGDKSFSTFFPALLRKFANNHEDGIMGTILSLFGIRQSLRSTDTKLNEWERGAIEYDGESKKALTEVIPSYLSKIAFTLDSIAHDLNVEGFSGAPKQVLYDWSDDWNTGGKFVTRDTLIERENEKQKEEAISGFRNSQREFNTNARSLLGNEKANELETLFENFLFSMVQKDISLDNRTGINELLKKSFAEKDIASVRAILDSLSQASQMEMAGSGVLMGREALNAYNTPKQRGGSIIANKNGIYNSILNPAVGWSRHANYYRGDRFSGIKINSGYETIDDSTLSEAEFNQKYSIDDPADLDRLNAELKKRGSTEKLRPNQMKKIIEAYDRINGSNRSGKSIVSSKEYSDQRLLLAKSLYEDYKKKENPEDDPNIEVKGFDEWEKENASLIDTNVSRDLLQKEIANKKALTEDNSGGGFFNSINKFFESPLAYVNKGLDKVDAWMYRIIFGDNNGDESIFRSIIKGIKSTFDKTINFFKEKVITPFKNFVFGEDINKSEWYQALKGGVKDSLLGVKDTQGNYSEGFFSDAINGTKSFFGDLKTEWTETVKPQIVEMFDLAKQSVFGEDKKEKSEEDKRPLLDKVKDTISTGVNQWTNLLFGNGKNLPDGDNAKINNEINKMIPGAKKGIVAGSIGGIVSGMGGFGVLGSWFLPGGPIGGAIVGGAIGMLSQSDRVKNYLFGEEKKNNKGELERVGGLIPKNLINWTKKNKVALVGGGMAGIVKTMLFGGVGLIPGVALGVMGPVLAGSAWALAMKSNVLKEELFGKEIQGSDGTKRVGGLINEEVRAKIKKSLPKALVGALGSMAGFTVLGELGAVGSMLALGPIPAAIAGAGVGILTASDNFNKAIFGEVDDKNVYHSGLLDKTKNLFFEKIAKPISIFGRKKALDTEKWFAKSIVYPISDAFLPLQVATKKLATGMMRHVDKTFRNIQEDFHKVFKKLGDSIFKIMNTVITPLKSVSNSIFSIMISGLQKITTLTSKAITAPLGLLGSVAENNLKKGAIGNYRKDAKNSIKRGFSDGSLRLIFNGIDNYSRSIFDKQGILDESYDDYVKDQIRQGKEPMSKEAWTEKYRDEFYDEFRDRKNDNLRDRAKREKKWARRERAIGILENRMKISQEEAKLRGYTLTQEQVNDKFRNVLESPSVNSYWVDENGNAVNVNTDEEEKQLKEAKEKNETFDKKHSITKAYEVDKENTIKKQLAALDKNEEGLSKEQIEEKRKTLMKELKTSTAISVLNKSEKAEDLIKHEEINLLGIIAKNTGTTSENILKVNDENRESITEAIEKNSETNPKIDHRNKDNNATEYAEAKEKERKENENSDNISATAAGVNIIATAMTGKQVDEKSSKSGGFFSNIANGAFGLVSGIFDLGKTLFGIGSTLVTGVGILSGIAAIVKFIADDDHTDGSGSSVAADSNAARNLVEIGAKKLTYSGIGKSIYNFGKNAFKTPKDLLEKAIKVRGVKQAEAFKAASEYTRASKYLLYKQNLPGLEAAVISANKLDPTSGALAEAKLQEAKDFLEKNADIENKDYNKIIANAEEKHNALKQIDAEIADRKVEVENYRKSHQTVDKIKHNKITEAMGDRMGKSRAAQNIEGMKEFSTAFGEKVASWKNHLHEMVNKCSWLDKLSTKTKNLKKTIINCFTELIDLVLKNPTIQKALMSKVGKGVTRTLMAGVTFGLSAVGFGVYDALSGFADASRTFDVAPEDVDFKMRMISSLVNVLFGLPGFFAIDAAFSLMSIAGSMFRNTAFGKILATMGIDIGGMDHRKWICQALYKLISSDEDGNALDANQQKLKDEYSRYLEENNLTQEDMDFERFKSEVKDNQTIWEKTGAPILKKVLGIEGREDTSGKGVKTLAEMIESPFETLVDWVKNGINDFIKNKTFGDIVLDLIFPIPRMIMGLVKDNFPKLNDSLTDSNSKMAIDYYKNLKDNDIAGGGSNDITPEQEFDITVDDISKSINGRFAKTNKEINNFKKHSFVGSGEGDPVKPTATSKKINDSDSGMPYYWEQTDPNLANKPVLSFDSGYGTFKDYGCAPTALAMVASMYNQTPIDPLQTSRFIRQEDVSYGDGFFSNTIKGIKPSYFRNASKDFNLNMTTIPSFGPDANGIMDYLYHGNAVILGGRNSNGPKDGVTPFTRSGHYVVVAGVDKSNPENVFVYDPLGRSGSYNAESVYDDASGLMSGGFAAAFNMGDTSPYKTTYGKNPSPSSSVNVDRDPSSSENAPILPPAGSAKIGLRDLGKYNNKKCYELKSGVNFNGLKSQTIKAIEYLSRYFSWLTDGVTLFITSTKEDYERENNTDSRHNLGWCFDCTEEKGDVHHEFRDDPELRNKFIEEASRVGVYVYDEYAQDSADKTGDHLHCDCEGFLEKSKPVPVASKITRKNMSFLDLISNLGKDFTSMMDASISGRKWSITDSEALKAFREVANNGGNTAAGEYNSGVNKGENDWYNADHDGQKDVYFEDGRPGFEFMPRTELFSYPEELNNRERYVAKYLKSKGYDLSSIAGILGNIKQENTEFKPDINNEKVGADGYPIGGLGLFQWNGSRKTAAINYANNNGKNIYDIKTQLDYMLEESDGEFYNVNKKNLNGYDPAQYAAWRFGAKFEKGRHLGRRQGYAKNYFSVLNRDSEFAGGGNMQNAVDRYAKANSQPRIIQNNKNINAFRDSENVSYDKENRIIRFMNNSTIGNNFNINELIHAIEDISSREELKEAIKYLKVIAINGAVSNEENGKSINAKARTRNSKPIANKIKVDNIRKMINTNTTLGNLERDAVAVAIEIAKGGSFRNI